MAIALEEIASGVVDSAVGPWALVLGAGAVAVAFATRPARPISRMVSGGVMAVDATGGIAPRRWIAALRQGMRDLVEEARAEYEAGRRRPHLTPDVAASVLAKAAPAPVADAGHVLIATESGVLSAEQESSRRRDARGRFVPRSPNGTAPA